MNIEAEIADLRALLTAALARIDDRPRELKAYKVAEVGPVLGVGRSTVDAMIASGDLPTVILPTMKDRRVPVAAVDALVAEDRWTAPLKAVG